MEKKFSDVAARLRRCIYAGHTNAAGFASDIGISEITLHSAYLSGRSMPGGDLLRRMALIGVNVHWLLTGEGLPPEPTEPEVQTHVAELRAKLEYWERWLRIYAGARREIAERVERELAIERGVSYNAAAEPTQKPQGKQK